MTIYCDTFMFDSALDLDVSNFCALSLLGLTVVFPLAWILSPVSCQYNIEQYKYRKIFFTEFFFFKSWGINYSLKYFLYIEMHSVFTLLLFFCLDSIFLHPKQSKALRSSQPSLVFISHNISCTTNSLEINMSVNKRSFFPITCLFIENQFHY